MALIALDPASDGLGGVLTDPSRATTARAFLDGHGADSPIMASMARPHAMACVRVRVGERAQSAVALAADTTAAALQAILCAAGRVAETADVEAPARAQA